MQIRQIKVSNFRGIAALNWKPGHSFCCLIGPGDSGKSTVLDAVEAALSSRWFSFTDPDFLGCDAANAIKIEVTIGELSRALMSDERFGLYIRGWTAAGELRDEPEDGDEPVLTVRLTVDATLEPVWEFVCDRIEDTRTLSNRDRSLFGLVRLAGEDSRHLSWGQGSVLSRLTGDNSEAAGRLSEAYRAARNSANLGSIESLASVAATAERFAKGLGAYVEGAYEPGLELGRSGLSSGSIALHDNGVPLRLAGLGTRRLATLAIQKSAIAEGAIILIDEIEHGLEPHRIIGAISQLKSDQATALGARGPVGQVLLTTHSDIALGESGCDGLYVVQTSRPARVTTLRAPASPEPIRALMRFTPRALFARRILVCEGMTEVGMILGLREFWPSRHNGKPIEQLGIAIADGNGGQACSMVLALADLGFPAALYRDSDVPLPPDSVAALAAANIPVIEYGDQLDTEQAIFYVASNVQVQRLLDLARENHGQDSVDDSLIPKIPGLDRTTAQYDFGGWELVCGKTGAELRQIIAEVANRKKWFKEQRIGRELGSIVWAVAAECHSSQLCRAIISVESWIYA